MIHLALNIAALLFLTWLAVNGIFLIFGMLAILFESFDNRKR